MTDTVEVPVNIYRATGFELATLANVHETITVIQFETAEGEASQLIALTPALVDSLRDRLRDHTTAALEVSYGR